MEYQTNKLRAIPGFLAVFLGMRVAHLGGQTGKPDAGRFGMVDAATRWAPLWETRAPQTARKFPGQPRFLAVKCKYPHCWLSMRVFDVLE